MTDTLPCASPPLLIQRLDRRERNRKHAKKSRIRKKALLETLQEQVASLRNENMSLRQVLKERLPDQASSILDKCTAEVSPTMLDPEAAFGMKHELVEHDFNMIQVGEPPVCLGQFRSLARSLSVCLAVPCCCSASFPCDDVQSLLSSQQCFAVSDPSLQDNPIVYVSGGFLKLTGYKMEDVSF